MLQFCYKFIQMRTGLHRRLLVIAESIYRCVPSVTNPKDCYLSKNPQYMFQSASKGWGYMLQKLAECFPTNQRICRPSIDSNWEFFTMTSITTTER